jgi:hypothetical protein
MLMRQHVYTLTYRLPFLNGLALVFVDSLFGVLVVGIMDCVPIHMVVNRFALPVQG